MFVSVDDKCGISIGTPGEKVRTGARARNAGRLVHVETSRDDMEAMDQGVGAVIKATPSATLFLTVCVCRNNNSTIEYH